jgi:hypothetical protein
MPAFTTPRLHTSTAIIWKASPCLPVPGWYCQTDEDKLPYEEALDSLRAFKLTFLHSTAKYGVAEWGTEQYRCRFDERDRQYYRESARGLAEYVNEILS